MDTDRPRTACPFRRVAAWCEVSPSCLAVHPELPGVRCTEHRNHRGQHAGQGRVWGDPKDGKDFDIVRCASKPHTIAALLGLAAMMPPPTPRRRR